MVLYSVISKKAPKRRFFTYDVIDLLLTMGPVELHTHCF